MRLVIAVTALGMVLGLAGTAQARCEKCPDGYTFWHSKNFCLADDGSGKQSQPLYWKADRAKAGATLHGARLGGRAGGNAGPAGGR